MFLEAVPANMLAARALCRDNEASNARFIHLGMLIRIRGDEKLVVNRGIIEGAIGRGLTENEWQSITWHYIGAISKFDQDELVFVDSEESRVIDEYWDKQIELINRKT